MMIDLTDDERRALVRVGTVGNALAAGNLMEALDRAIQLQSDVAIAKAFAFAIAKLIEPELPDGAAIFREAVAQHEGSTERRN